MICLCVITIGAGAAVGHEGELSNTIFHTSAFELLFALSNPGNFRVGVDDTRDGVVVDMTTALDDVLHTSDAYLVVIIMIVKNFTGRGRLKYASSLGTVNLFPLI